MIETPFISHSPEDTVALAGRMVIALRPGAVLALYGDLGSGKTCFVRGLALALGIETPVTSPTFTLINEYHGTTDLFHMDLYRLSNAEAVLALGLDDYLEGEGITAIEWPERAETLLPSHTLHIRFEIQPDHASRLITCNQGVS